jgi:hypothetical protein
MHSRATLSSAEAYDDNGTSDREESPWVRLSKGPVALCSGLVARNQGFDDAGRVLAFFLTSQDFLPRSQHNHLHLHLLIDK